MLNLKSKLFTFRRASAYKASKVEYSQYWGSDVKILTKEALSERSDNIMPFTVTLNSTF